MKYKHSNKYIEEKKKKLKWVPLIFQPTLGTIILMTWIRQNIGPHEPHRHCMPPPQKILMKSIYVILQLLRILLCRNECMRHCWDHVWDSGPFGLGDKKYWNNWREKLNFTYEGVTPLYPSFLWAENLYCRTVETNTQYLVF